MDDNFEGSQQEEEEEIQEDPDELGKTLIKVAASGNLEEAQTLIRKNANIHFTDKKGWNPLMWASSQGHEEVVKLLLDTDMPLRSEEPPKYTPLHWASFNGHIKVVWLLMKRGFSPLDIDVYGNNCIHHAAAGSRLDILETFIGFGVSVDHKNTRSHLPYDLATDSKIKEVIQSARKAKKCINCHGVFDIHKTRHLCSKCKKYFCNSCCNIQWVYLSNASVEEDRPVCRCHQCQRDIEEFEDQVQSALAEDDFAGVEAVYKSRIERSLDINAKIIHALEVAHLRLLAEKEIKDFVNTLSYVENYKTIQKSVYLIGLMLSTAKEKSIELSPNVVELANATQEKLMSERNLRHQVGTADFSVASEDTVSTLDDLISKAETNTVASEYVENAKIIRNKIQDNLDAHFILERFIEYPLREYPEPEPVDPKKRGPAKPEDKKAPPKKKKKEPKFNIPEWATQISDLVKEVDTLEKLMRKAEEIMLDPQFLADAKENVIRMKKEIKFRQQLEEEARLEAERKAAAKKSAAKK